MTFKKYTLNLDSVHVHFQDSPNRKHEESQVAKAFPEWGEAAIRYSLSNAKFPFSVQMRIAYRSKAVLEIGPYPLKFGTE
jgi:hypothetical protein